MLHVARDIVLPLLRPEGKRRPGDTMPLLSQPPSTQMGTAREMPDWAHVQCPRVYRDLEVAIRVPFVSSFILSVSQERKCVSVQLPDGLTAIARKEAFLKLAAAEMRPYVAYSACPTAPRVTIQGRFPSLRRLDYEMGRPDLGCYIEDAGGITAVRPHHAGCHGSCMFALRIRRTLCV